MNAARFAEGARYATLALATMEHQLKAMDATLDVMRNAATEAELKDALNRAYLGVSDARLAIGDALNYATLSPTKETP